MNEVELPIVTNGQYKNISLKENVNQGQKGLDPYKEEFIVVKKLYPNGMEVNGKFGLSFSCRAEYKNEEVSFWLTPHQHKAYSECGGVDDKVRIIACVTDGSKGKYKAFRFEKVE